jgi:hypothetical protein
MQKFLAWPLYRQFCGCAPYRMDSHSYSHQRNRLNRLMRGVAERAAFVVYLSGMRMCDLDESSQQHKSNTQQTDPSGPG